MVEEEDVLLEGENEHEAPVPIGLCGEDEVPEMSEYKKLREQNIKEREEMMKEVMEEINEAKQDMYDNAPKRKIADTTDEPKPKKRRGKSADTVHVRRSARERKPVNYKVDEDDEGRSRIKKKNCSNHQPEASKHEEVSSSVASEGQASSSRTLRPRKPVCYTEFPEPDVDSYIW